MNNNDFEKAKECAFWYLNRRRYTKKQVVDKLVGREYTPEIAKTVADHLEERGYIDDRDYTRRYVLDAVKIKKHGLRRIKNDLSLKGISSALVDKVVEENDIDCNLSLPSLLEVKAARLDLRDIKQRNKISAFLVRRGFSYGDINAAISEYLIKRESTD